MVAINAGVPFNGSYIYRPGVYTKVDASAMVPGRQGPGGIVGVIGSSANGAPGYVYEFRSFSDAAKVLGDGPILSYLSRIFRPSPDQPGASIVRFVRSNAATQATYTAVAVNLILGTADYGLNQNGFLFSISTSGTADATLSKRSGAGAAVQFYPQTATIENPLLGYKKSYLLRDGLTLACTKGVTTGKNSLLRSANATSGIFYLQEDNVTVAQLAFDATTTLAQVRDWISSRAGWTVQVVGDYNMPAYALEAPLSVGAPGAGGFSANAIPTDSTAFFMGANLTGGLGYKLDVYDAAIGVSTLVDPVAALPASVVQAPFAGGTGSASDVMDSTALNGALAVLATTECDFVFIQSMSSSLQQLVRQHCIDMGNVTAKRYRIGVLGYNASGNSNAWVDAAVQAAKDLDGPCVLCANGTSIANPTTGVVENLNGLGFAAQVVGMAAGRPASDPVTNKAVLSSGLQYPNISASDMDKLLIGGVTVAVMDYALGRSVVLQAITTYQGGSNVAFRKLQGLRIQFSLQKGFLAALSPFVGMPLDLITGQLVYAAVGKFLDSQVRSSSNPDGILTQGFKDGASLPAWQGLRITSDGLDVWNIEVETHPVGESDFILVSAKLTPVAIQL